MASEEEFARQDEELVDLRFSLRRADAELEILRRERNMLQKELVMREAEIERAREFLDRAHLLARAEAAEAIAGERLSRLQGLENALSKLRRKPSSTPSSATSTPGGPTTAAVANDALAQSSRFTPDSSLLTRAELTGSAQVAPVAPTPPGAVQEMRKQPQAPAAPQAPPATAAATPGFVADPLVPPALGSLAEPQRLRRDGFGTIADLSAAERRDAVDGDWPEGTKRRRRQSRRALP